MSNSSPANAYLIDDSYMSAIECTLNGKFIAYFGMLVQAIAIRASALAIRRDNISPANTAARSMDSDGPSR